MDDDLIAYLEKKIKTLEAENQKLRKAIRNAGFQILQTSGDWSIHDVSELAKNDQERTDQVIAENIDLRMELVAMKAERDHWKSNHDNQVKLKNEVAEARFVAMKNQIDDLLLENRRLRLSLGYEDPRGDGDLLPESERLDDLTRECMRDELAASANDLAGDASGIEAAMRRRLMEPFLGKDAKVLGAEIYKPQGCEWWEVLRADNTWKRWDNPKWWPATTYRLAINECNDD